MYVVILLLSLAHAFEVVNLGLEYKQISGGTVMPELPAYSLPRGELNLNLDLMIIGPLYLKNQIWSVIDQSQFRAIGWHYEIGIFIMPWLQVYAEHFSKHVLDTQNQGHFPVYDSFGLRVNFI